MVANEELLPQAVLRQIGDKLYEKRKVAALEVEQVCTRVCVFVVRVLCWVPLRLCCQGCAQPGSLTVQASGPEVLCVGRALVQVCCVLVEGSTRMLDATQAARPATANHHPLLLSPHLPLLPLPLLRAGADRQAPRSGRRGRQDLGHHRQADRRVCLLAAGQPPQGVSPC